MKNDKNYEKIVNVKLNWRKKRQSTLCFVLYNVQKKFAESNREKFEYFW